MTVRPTRPIRPARGLAAVPAAVATALAVLLVAVLAAGCADTPPAPTAAPADIAFVSGMLPHHRQAVAMSALAADRASSPQVRDLAATIDREQGPEIERMTGMLAAWGAPEAAHDAHGGHAMPGMMGDDAMAALGKLSGPAFDDAFLRMMIEHHDGAVRMAATETAEGRDPAALDLARSITTAQQAEIGRMSAMLQRR